jgi:putative sterol carrier protein
VLENVLRHFLAACEDDAALKAFAQTHTLSVHYTLSDAALEFFMSFALGEVQAGLGPPPAPAAVRLKLSAELLDGLMTGKINGMNAVMQGVCKVAETALIPRPLLPLGEGEPALTIGSGGPLVRSTPSPSGRGQG